MIAAQRFKGLGWFAAVVVVSLGFYLVSLQVAAERGKLEAVDRAIVQAHRDIRSLETEFDTRANLAQLENWNGTVLSLTAPTAAQFVAGEAAFAQLNALGQAPKIETAALIVPSGVPAPTPAAVVAPAVVAGQTAAVVGPPARTPPASARPAAASQVAEDPPVAVAAVPRPAALTRAAAPVRATATAVAPHGKGVGVALLDDKLLSDTTLGDLMKRARIETGKAR